MCPWWRILSTSRSSCLYRRPTWWHSVLRGSGWRDWSSCWSRAPSHLGCYQTHASQMAQSSQTQFEMHWPHCWATHSTLPWSRSRRTTCISRLVGWVPSWSTTTFAWCALATRFASHPQPPWAWAPLSTSYSESGSWSRPTDTQLCPWTWTRFGCWPFSAFPQDVAYRMRACTVEGRLDPLHLEEDSQSQGGAHERHTPHGRAWQSVACGAESQISSYDVDLAAASPVRRVSSLLNPLRYTVSQNVSAACGCHEFDISCSFHWCEKCISLHGSTALVWPWAFAPRWVRQPIEEGWLRPWCHPARSCYFIGSLSSWCPCVRATTLTWCSLPYVVLCGWLWYHLWNLSWKSTRQPIGRYSV